MLEPFVTSNKIHKKMIKKSYIFLFSVILLINNCSANETEPAQNNKWKFIVLSDTHIANENPNIISEMMPYILEENAELILICGDLVQGGKRADSETLRTEFTLWKEYFKPLIDKGIKIYPVRGNHEDDAEDNIKIWNEVFAGTLSLPQNGPDGEKNQSYSFSHNNAFFVALDTYTNIHRVNQSWLNDQFSSNKSQHKFVFGHEAAFKAFHSDCLDDFPEERNTFWQSMSNAGVKAYFCGHDHFYDVTSIDDGDGIENNDIYQFIVGGGGGWLMPKYNYNGDNSYFTPNQEEHKEEHGYLLVEIDDKNVTLQWKGRTTENGNVQYIPSGKVIKYSIE